MTLADFAISRLPETEFGVGAIERIGGTLPDHLGGVLIVADPAMHALGVVGRVADMLHGGGRRIAIFDDIESDPTETQVESGLIAATEAGADAVIAIGGGSALDVGKAIAALSGSRDPVAAFRLSARSPGGSGLYAVAVPTTAGTGSEATRTSVLTGDDHVKYWFWDGAFRFDTVILDPALTVSLPRHLTAATGADALVHAIEAATNARASPASRMFAHQAIHCLAGSLEQAINTPDDLGARGTVLWAAYLAGCAIDQSGCALAHCFGHALGSLTAVHHGRAVAIAMVAGADAVAEANPQPFAEIAIALRAPADHRAFGGAFSAFMERIGLDLSLPAEAAGLTAETLVATASEPANIDMLRVTVGEFGRESLGLIAEKILARRPAFV